jgi:hypothetical protein
MCSRSLANDGAAERSGLCAGQRGAAQVAGELQRGQTVSKLRTLARMGVEPSFTSTRSTPVESSPQRLAAAGRVRGASDGGDRNPPITVQSAG